MSKIADAPLPVVSQTEIDHVALDEDYVLTAAFVEKVVDASDAGDGLKLRSLLEDLHPADVADLMGAQTAVSGDRAEVLAGAAVLAAAIGFLVYAGRETGVSGPAGSYELVASFGLGSLLVLLWAWLFERRGPAALGLNAKGPLRFLRGYLIGAAFLLTVVGVIWAAGGYVAEGAGAFGSAAVGAALVFGGAFLYSIYLVGSSQVVQRVGSMRFTASTDSQLLMAAPASFLGRFLVP
mgnify:CR=1 FL=1